MADQKLTVGRVTVRHVLDWVFWADPIRLFPTVEAHQWDRYRDLPYVNGARYLNQQGLMRVTLGSYVLSSQGKTILVDTGIGGKDRQPRFNAGPGDLMSNLAAAGVRPEDIDIVTFTHLHIDHVGWNVTWQDGRGKPTFPRARYLVNRKEWDYWMQEPRLSEEENKYLRDSVEPLKNWSNVELIDQETSITDEITLLPLPGHTPGHVGLMISSGGERGYIAGDATIHPVQVLQPEWWIFPDVDHSVGIQSRQKLLELAAQDNSSYIAGHHMEPGFGRVQHVSGGYEWQALAAIDDEQDSGVSAS